MRNHNFDCYYKKKHESDPKRTLLEIQIKQIYRTRPRDTAKLINPTLSISQTLLIKSPSEGERVWLWTTDTNPSRERTVRIRHQWRILGLPGNFCWFSIFFFFKRFFFTHSTWRVSHDHEDQSICVLFLFFFNCQIVIDW